MNKNRLFVASSLSLFACALAFGSRAGYLTRWMTEFGLSDTEAGWIAGIALWGLTLAVFLFGLFVEVWGAGKVIAIMFITQLTGTLLTIFASGFWSLAFATLLLGVANGCVNAACNPIVTSLYSNEKSGKLNRFHMWNSLGIAIGGLIVFFFDEINVGWRYQMTLLLIPTIIYGFMFYKQKYPPTERVLSGGSYKDMMKSLASPLFIFLAIVMVLTSGTEFGANQWIPALFEKAIADSGLLGDNNFGSILILVWISLVMVFARLVATPVVRIFTSVGVLFISSILVAVGIYLMSIVDGIAVFAASTIFAVGIAYFWPNMIGLVAERRPMTGALGMAIIGGMGTLGGAVIQPVIGAIFDYEKTQHATEMAAGAVTLQYITIIPVILIVIFGIMFLKQKREKNTVS